MLPVAPPFTGFIFYVHGALVNIRGIDTGEGGKNRTMRDLPVSANIVISFTSSHLS